MFNIIYVTITVIYHVDSRGSVVHIINDVLKKKK